MGRVVSMSFAFYGMLAAIALLIFAILVKYKGGTKWFTATIKRKVITFGTPHRLELIFVALYFGFFFVADIAQNKAIDLGQNYQVIYFWNHTAPVTLIWQIMLILFQAALFALFLLSLQSKDTNRIFDIIVGFAAVFALCLLWSGVVAQLHQSTAYLFGATLRGIDYYHIGIYILVFTGLYYAFTK